VITNLQGAVGLNLTGMNNVHDVLLNVVLIVDQSQIMCFCMWFDPLVWWSTDLILGSMIAWIRKSVT